jgi:DNA-binding Lrp family transcriptional regulator
MMDELDLKLLEDLLNDSRVSYAELGRKYNLSRVCIRERINNLVEEGVIEKFTIVVNPEKLGKKLAVFFDIEVKPDALYSVANDLAQEENITNIYLMTGSPTLYVNALLSDHDELEAFLREKIYSRKEIIRVYSNILLKKFKSPRGGLCP